MNNSMIIEVLFHYYVVPFIAKKYPGQRNRIEEIVKVVEFMSTVGHVISFWKLMSLPFIV